MTRNAIQEERMRGYFIQATKEILKAEGFNALSVRNIADKAGYSYATLYNYFKDVRELVFECVVDFQAECKAFIDAQVDNSPPGIIRIKAILRAYMMYFLEYPGVFDLFFIEKADGIEGKRSTSKQIFEFPDQLCASDWEHCKREGLFSANKVAAVRKQVIFLTSGLLLFYLNRRTPLQYHDFIAWMDEQLDHALGT